MVDSFNDITNKISAATANRIEQMVKTALNRLQSSNVKAIYSEQEAADFLGITKIQLQRYRTNGLINFIHYPSATGFPSKRNCLYSYHLTDLMNFAATHHRKGVKVREVYKFVQKIDAAGLRIE